MSVERRPADTPTSNAWTRFLGVYEVLPSALIPAPVFICDQAESFSPSKFLQSTNSAIVCRCQTLAHLLCLSARHSMARVLSVSISLFLARTLFFSQTIIRMMTTITIMSSFPSRFDHDEDHLFGQPSLAACILASKFLSDTYTQTNLVSYSHLWNIVLTSVEV
jgi:hypothetical protein